MKRVFKAIWNYIKKLDIILLFLCVAASAFGVVLLYTLNVNEISYLVTSSQYKTHIVATVLGLIAALILAKIDYRIITKYWVLYAPVALLCSLLLFTPLGIQAEGADDIGWLNLGFIVFQPSEVLKVVFILTFSYHLHKVKDKMNRLPHFILLCIHGMIPAGLTSLQGDDGSALVFLFVFLVMMFTAGVAVRYILAFFAVIPPGLYIAWNYLMQPHHKSRILILFDEEMQQQELLGRYMQQYLGKIALGSGELTGRGLIGGVYKYVPAIHTDYIFAYIGMTLGFVGCVATVVLLLLICLKILSVSSMARDVQGRMICIGVFTLVSFHSIVNIGMVLAVVPVIGIPLPFLSAGGTAVLSMFISIGLVLSVYAHREKPYQMFSHED